MQSSSSTDSWRNGFCHVWCKQLEHAAFKLTSRRNHLLVSSGLRCRVGTVHDSLQRDCCNCPLAVLLPIAAASQILHVDSRLSGLAGLLVLEAAAAFVDYHKTNLFVNIASVISYCLTSML